MIDGRPRYRGVAAWEHGALRSRGRFELPRDLPGADGREGSLTPEAAVLELQHDGRARFEGRLGGAFRPATLAQALNPLCGAARSDDCARSGETLLEAALRYAEPDLDLDGDGLERIDLDGEGRVRACFDGDGSSVLPLAYGVPASCADDPRMADGFSISFLVGARGDIGGLAAY